MLPELDTSPRTAVAAQRAPGEGRALSWGGESDEEEEPEGGGQTRGSGRRRSRVCTQEYRVEKLQRRLEEAKRRIQTLTAEGTVLREQLAQAEGGLSDARSAQHRQRGAHLLRALREVHDSVAGLLRDQQLLQRGAEEAVRAAAGMLAARIKEVDDDYTALLVGGAAVQQPAPAPAPAASPQQQQQQQGKAGRKEKEGPRPPSSQPAVSPPPRLDDDDGGLIRTLQQKVQDLVIQLAMAHDRSAQAHVASQKSDERARELRAELGECVAERDTLKSRLQLLRPGLGALQSELGSLRQWCNSVRWKVRYLNNLSPQAAWDAVRRRLAMGQQEFLERTQMVLHDADADSHTDPTHLLSFRTKRASFMSGPCGTTDDGLSSPLLDSSAPVAQSYYDLVRALKEANGAIAQYRCARSDVEELRREVEILSAARREQADRERELRMDLNEERRTQVLQRIETATGGGGGGGGGGELAAPALQPTPSREQLGASNRLTKRPSVAGRAAAAPPSPHGEAGVPVKSAARQRLEERSAGKPKWNNSTKTIPPDGPDGLDSSRNAPKECRLCRRPFGETYSREEVEQLFATIERLRASALASSQQVSELRGKVRELNDVRDWVRQEKRRLKKEQEIRDEEKRRLEKESKAPPRSDAHNALRLAKHVQLLQADLADMRVALRDQASRAQRDTDRLEDVMRSQQTANLGLAHDLTRERQAKLQVEEQKSSEQQRAAELARSREEAQEEREQLRAAVDALQQRIDLLAQEIISAQQREQAALAQVEQLRDELRDAEQELYYARKAQPRAAPPSAMSGLEADDPGELHASGRAPPAALTPAVLAPDPAPDDDSPQRWDVTRDRPGRGARSPAGGAPRGSVSKPAPPAASPAADGGRRLSRSPQAPQRAKGI